MVERSYLMVIPFLVLITGIYTITIVFVPIDNTFSLIHENQNNSVSFFNNTTQSQITISTNTTFLKQVGLNALSQHLNKTISNLMAIAESSMNRSNSFGTLPLVNITSDMKIKYHGIPSDQDLKKRNEAKELLVNNNALLYVGLLLPNGDRYFGEPYSPYQTDSPTTNFAYRDHFIGALKTKQPYLGNVINAVTTGEPLAILANPIYSDSKNPDSLIAIQVMGLNFSYFNNLIKSTIWNEDSNKRAVIVDNNGMEIADSSFNNNNLESFNILQSFQNAKNGESGQLIEEVNGKNMKITFTPINFAQTKWVILLFSSNE